MGIEQPGKDTNLHTENLRDWRRGDILEAKKLQEPVTLLKQIFNGVRPGRQVRRRGGVSLTVKNLEVVSVEADYLICRFAEDPTATDQIQVALQPEFRRQIYDFDTTLEATGTGYTRTLPNGRVNKFIYLNTQKRKAINVDDEDDTEVQVITTAFVRGDIVMAMTGIQGGTGLTIKVGGVNVPIPWQDMSISGRAWAKADDQDDES